MEILVRFELTITVLQTVAFPLGYKTYVYCVKYTYGTPGRNRTLDFSLRRRILYLLSYWRMFYYLVYIDSSYIFVS